MSDSFVPEDIFLESVISDLHISPNDAVLCSVKKADQDRDSYSSCIWLLSTMEPGTPRQLTWGASMDSAPRWSPDAKQIAYLSDKQNPGVAQIYLLACNGGEPRQLTHLSRGASEIRWRPDGKMLLAIGTTTVDPDQREQGCDRHDGACHNAPDPNAPQLCWRLPYKLDGSGYLLNSRSHLFIVDSEDGTATQLTSGDYNVQSAAWSPDGSCICISRTRQKDKEYHRTDIWLLKVEDGVLSSCEQLSFEQSNSSSPSWSPDGRWIVFMGSHAEGDAQMRLWIIDVKTKTVAGLGPVSLEVLAGDLCWSRDSRSIGFIRVHKGLQCAALISVPDGNLTMVAGGNRHLSSMVLGEGFVYIGESAHEPQEIYFKKSAEGDEQKISNFNDWWDDKTPLTSNFRSFDVPDGSGKNERIDAWVLTSATQPGSAKNGKKPLLVDFHGGPASYADLKFSTHPYWQLLASQGWIVIAANAVGSSSYGREFSDRLRGKWGELDWPQHLAIVNQLQSEGLASEHVAVCGTSYGGFLAAYCIARNHKLSAAVICAPVANIESHFGTSDTGYYSDAYAMDTSRKDFRSIVNKLSPAFSIDKAKTPTLFLQGANDERCPRAQTEELFVKLAYLGTAKTEMVLYPGAGHSFSVSGKPSHRIDALRRITEWLASHQSNYKR